MPDDYAAIVENRSLNPVTLEHFASFWRISSDRPYAPVTDCWYAAMAVVSRAASGAPPARSLIRAGFMRAICYYMWRRPSGSGRF